MFLLCKTKNRITRAVCPLALTLKTYRSLSVLLYGATCAPLCSGNDEGSGQMGGSHLCWEFITTFLLFLLTFVIRPTIAQMFTRGARSRAWFSLWGLFLSPPSAFLLSFSLLFVIELEFVSCSPTATATTTTSSSCFTAASTWAAFVSPHKICLLSLFCVWPISPTSRWTVGAHTHLILLLFHFLCSLLIHYLNLIELSN